MENVYDRIAYIGNIMNTITLGRTLLQQQALLIASQ